MIEHLISREKLEQFKRFMREKGIEELTFYSKGITSLVFLGKFQGKKVIVKLEREDTPRKNFKREAEILKLLEGHSITPELINYGIFEGKEYLVREFAEGEPLLYADVEKHHLIEIAKKTHKLDVLGIDHGQIQGGKHIIIGEAVWIIDFEKASTRRKPKNLTSAMAMLFLNENVISKRIREKFEINKEFLAELRKALREYKESKNVKKILTLISSL
ncbi:serine/threonine protein kinase [Thermococcus sp. M39]|uniref:serine/threonine protein kinase n=1 Tax=unclassified Thermococcus TaxID=2627626 RepID=UPI00143A0A05|nr:MULTISPECIES: serine/threonine protein kinase [unclassified Thermococcus]NJE08304.1 serine/threonine protein kinase [Thermococcus sp. M39]NJE11797.1 serine/threonine protein kinase [Thermococcus sp. LS2]